MRALCLSPAAALLGSAAALGFCAVRGYHAYRLNLTKLQRAFKTIIPQCPLSARVAVIISLSSSARASWIINLQSVPFIHNDLLACLKNVLHLLGGLSS